MTPKEKPVRTVGPATPLESTMPPWMSPPSTTEERVRRIEAMLRQITGYAQFMCAVDPRNGTSLEERDRAVAAFYDRMVLLERQLARIQEEFRLR